MAVVPRARLRDAIFRSRRTQKDIAEAVGITPAEMSKIVHGRVNPTEAEEKAIAKVLRQPVGELFGQEVA